MHSKTMIFLVFFRDSFYENKEDRSERMRKGKSYWIGTKEIKSERRTFVSQEFLSLKIISHFHFYVTFADNLKDILHTGK